MFSKVKSDAETIKRSYGQLCFLTPRQSLFENLRVSLITIEPTQKTSKHSHPQEEVWYIVSGSGLAIGKDSHFRVCSGETILISTNEVHQLENMSPELELVFLAIMSPPRESEDVTYYPE